MDFVSYMSDIPQVFPKSLLTRRSVMPDLLTIESVNALHLWEGSWSYLPQLKWVKVTSEGEVRPATFPSS